MPIPGTPPTTKDRAPGSTIYVLAHRGVLLALIEYLAGCGMQTVNDGRHFLDLPCAGSLAFR